MQMKASGALRAALVATLVLGAYSVSWCDSLWCRNQWRSVSRAWQGAWTDLENGSPTQMAPSQGTGPPGQAGARDAQGRDAIRYRGLTERQLRTASTGGTGRSSRANTGDSRHTEGRDTQGRDTGTARVQSEAKQLAPIVQAAAGQSLLDTYQQRQLYCPLQCPPMRPGCEYAPYAQEQETREQRYSRYTTRAYIPWTTPRPVLQNLFNVAMRVFVTGEEVSPVDVFDAFFLSRNTEKYRITMAAAQTVFQRREREIRENIKKASNTEDCVCKCDPNPIIRECEEEDLPPKIPTEVKDPETDQEWTVVQLPDQGIVQQITDARRCRYRDDKQKCNKGYGRCQTVHCMATLLIYKDDDIIPKRFAYPKCCACV